MKVFEILPEFASDYYISGVWSPEQKSLSPYPKGIFYPTKDLQFPEPANTKKVGAIPNDQIRELSELWYVLNLDKPFVPDVISEFSISVTSLPAVSQAIADALVQLCPDDIQLIPFDRFWNEKLNEKIQGGPFSFVHVLSRQNSWESSRMKVSTITRPDGSTFETVGGVPRVVNAAALGTARIWRETRTNTVLRDGTVRDVLIATGYKGWRFGAVEVI
jgi:hypothetical protein